MRIIYKIYYISILITLLLATKNVRSQQLTPEKNIKLYEIDFDKNFKVLGIVCRDTAHKIFPKISRSGEVLPNTYSFGYRFCCYAEENFRCRFSFFRLILMTDDEALAYIRTKETTLSYKGAAGIRDYYMIQEAVSNKCKPAAGEYKYHALFNPEYISNGNIRATMPLSRFFQSASYMGITASGTDSIVSQGYCALLEKDGSPMYDFYQRIYGDFEFFSYCNANRSGSQNDIYVFKFLFKGHEYFRVASGNLYKALWLTDPYNDKSSMIAVDRNDGSVDYIVGELNDLYERYIDNNLPRVQTNTTLFLKNMLSKYPNLVLWNILKPTRNFNTDLVKFGDIPKDLAYFAKLLEGGYLQNQSLWMTLLDTGGPADNNRTWKDPNDRYFYADVLY